MNISRLLPVLSLLLLLHVSPLHATSLTFNLPYGQRKCFSDDLPPSTSCRGTVHVTSGKGEMSLDLFVTDPRGTVFFHKSDVNSVKFSFRTGSFQQHTTQKYRFCVVNQVHPHAVHAADVVRKVTLDVEAITEHREKAISRLAKQDHADKLYADFLAASQLVDNMIEKMDDLRVSEQFLTDLNQSTATTILRVSMVACVLTVATGVLNFLSLKSFFKRKKLA